MVGGGRGIAVDISSLCVESGSGGRIDGISGLVPKSAVRAFVTKVIWGRTGGPLPGIAMNKPNPMSVTSTPCTCGYLQRMANDSNSPIAYDETVNEYHYQSLGGARLAIYHCPWCGGVAPNSHRSSLFHELKRESCDAICNRTASCATLDDVIAILGQPDDDEYTGVRYHEKPDRPPRVDRVRRITFHDLYEEMIVSFEQRFDGAIAVSFSPKPLETGR